MLKKSLKSNKRRQFVVMEGMGQIEFVDDFSRLLDMQQKGLLKRKIIFETVYKTKKELFGGDK